MSTVLSAASGSSGNRARISSSLLRYNSWVSKRIRAGSSTVLPIWMHISTS